MPLSKGKSDKAFEHNIKAEMNSGKPQKQAVAVAYAVRRRAKHMSHGGPVEQCYECGGLVESAEMPLEDDGDFLSNPYSELDTEEHEHTYPDLDNTEDRGEPMKDRLKSILSKKRK